MRMINAEFCVSVKIELSRSGTRQQGSYNGRILGKKSENQTFALFWSEFGGIFKSLEKFGGI